MSHESDNRAAGRKHDHQQRSAKASSPSQHGDPAPTARRNGNRAPSMESNDGVGTTDEIGGPTE